MEHWLPGFEVEQFRAANQSLSVFDLTVETNRQRQKERGFPLQVREAILMTSLRISRPAACDTGPISSLTLAWYSWPEFSLHLKGFGLLHRCSIKLNSLRPLHEHTSLFEVETSKLRRRLRKKEQSECAAEGSSYESDLRAHVGLTWRQVPAKRTRHCRLETGR